MASKFLSITEVGKIMQVDEGFIGRLEREEIVRVTQKPGSPEKLLSEQELEKLRLAKLLMEEMEVNLPGVEIILRMRQNMFDMRKQFDDILADMASEMRRLMK